MKTFVLLAAFGGLFMLIGSFWGVTGLCIGLAIGLVFVGGSYWFSDKLAVTAAGAQPVDRAEAPELYAIVRDLAQRAGMPMPRDLHVAGRAAQRLRDRSRPEPRRGLRSPQGLLQILEPDELRGVLAHEMSHVKNRDILIGSIAATLAMGDHLHRRMAMWGAIFSGGGTATTRVATCSACSRWRSSRRSRRPRHPDGDQPLARVRSRSLRRGAARHGRAPRGALEKIEAYAKQVPMDVPPAQATAYIVNPLTGRKIDFGTMFTTHPPTADRVARLRHQF